MTDSNNVHPVILFMVTFSVGNVQSAITTYNKLLKHNLLYSFSYIATHTYGNKHKNNLAPPFNRIQEYYNNTYLN